MDNIRIPRLFLVDARPIREGVYSRPFSLNATNDSLQTLGAMIHDEYHNPRGNLSEVDLAKYVPNIINLDPNPCKIDVVNGWNEKRARFMMEVEVNFGSTIIKTYIQGYTDYIDATAISGLLDNNMAMYMNSILTVSITRDPVSGRCHVNRQEFYNVIPGDRGNSPRFELIDTNSGMVKKLIRPEDVLTSLIVTEKYEGLNSQVYMDADNVNRNVTSSRAHNDPLKYFKSITNAFIDAKGIANTPDDRLEIFSETQKILYENDITRNPFINALWNATGELLPASFSLGILELIDPGVRPIYTARTEAPIVTKETAFLQTENTESTFQPTPEAIKANIIATTIPTYMCEAMITNLVVSMTNINNEPTVIVSSFNSFVEYVDLVRQVNLIISKIEHILLPKLTDGNYTVVEVFVSADILGEIVIGIGLNHQEPIVYRFPCYADGLYAPVVSTSEQKQLLVNDFQNVLETTYK